MINSTKRPALSFNDLTKNLASCVFEFQYIFYIYDDRSSLFSIYSM